MWEDELPGPSDLLRQGDLLAWIPFPRRGTLQLAVDEMRANVYPQKPALVLDQCCTVEQKHTVLLARVGEVRRLPPEHALMHALTSEPEAGERYSKYFHLLVPNEILVDKANKLWVVELLERVSIAEKDIDKLAWLQDKRVGRMTPIARAKLRMRLLYHFSTVADDDRQALKEAGVDDLGRVIPPMDEPFPGVDA